MRAAVVGGTGTLGRPVVAELRARGHEVRVLSRKSPDHPVDLLTGAGLEEALAGCDVVVDASNDQSKRAADVLVEGSRRLLDAGRAAGVAHHVCVSIVGCDQVPMKYFRTKTDQERVVTEGPVPWTIVRATQFHEFVAEMLRWPVVPVPRAVVQTVSSDETARAVADVAEGPARNGRVEVAGPEVLDARALARTLGRRALPLPLPGRFGRTLREGALTSERPDFQGTTTFATWVAEERR